MQSSPGYKLSLFSILWNVHIFDTEYPQEMCSPFFAVITFTVIYFSIKDSRSLLIIHGVLSELIHWLSFNILSFWVGKVIPQKSLFLHIFSWHLSFLFEKNEDYSS